MLPIRFWHVIDGFEPMTGVGAVCNSWLWPFDSVHLEEYDDSVNVIDIVKVLGIFMELSRVRELWQTYMHVLFAQACVLWWAALHSVSSARMGGRSEISAPSCACQGFHLRGEQRRFGCPSNGSPRKLSLVSGGLKVTNICFCLLGATSRRQG